MVIRALRHTNTQNYTPIAYVLLVIAGIINLYITLHLPLTPSHASGSPALLYLVETSIVVAQVCIWLIAFRCASMLMQYAYTIRQTADGKGMIDIAHALLWLIVYIVLVPLSSSLADQSAGKSYDSVLMIVHNHVPIAAMILTVYFLYRGSRQLLRLSHTSPAIQHWRIIILALFALGAVLFAWHFYSDFAQVMAQKQPRQFVLSRTVLMFTYILPHIIAWLVGTLALLNLWQYSTQVEGSIYRLLFRNLYKGIFLIFACTFVVQLLMVATIELSSFSIGMVIVYIVLLLGILGYGFVYRGVQQLVKIEAVT